MNPLSKEVRDKIGELVGHGVTSVSEMRRHLQVFVDTVLFKEMKRPALSDAAYYPTDDTIKTHIYLSQLRLRYLIYILSFLSNYFIQQMDICQTDFVVFHCNSVSVGCYVIGVERMWV